MPDEKIVQTLVLLYRVWTLMLIALYGVGVMSAYYFPEPVEAGAAAAKPEEVLINIQRVLFFGLMAVGVLIDLVRMREDRHQAFIFLLLSLVAGGFSSWITAFQYKLLAPLMAG
ncbi:MAG: hypothetical protein COV67_02610 [Nitrospinae bacterium CG11_big_fil_rev_8_21_14_0_20_56_8]|nr:MAG: hypothetical protein COV67_02610 [Nitrospinae bacterium CG11_big_fil_rev_8_21_14_0_20_56_8]